MRQKTKTSPLCFLSFHQYFLYQLGFAGIAFHFTITFLLYIGLRDDGWGKLQWISLSHFAFAGFRWAGLALLWGSDIISGAEKPGCDVVA